jgi:hypothetical protein
VGLPEHHLPVIKWAVIAMMAHRLASQIHAAQAQTSAGSRQMIKDVRVGV